MPLRCAPVTLRDSPQRQEEIRNLTGNRALATRATGASRQTQVGRSNVPMQVVGREIEPCLVLCPDLVMMLPSRRTIRPVGYRD